MTDKKICFMCCRNLDLFTLLIIIIEEIKLFVRGSTVQMKRSGLEKSITKCIKKSMQNQI